MKQLAASIVGIFALGLVLGSFVSGSGSKPELPELEIVELEAALQSTALVDCGEGREALLEPVRSTVRRRTKCAVCRPSPCGARASPRASRRRSYPR